MEAVFPYKAVVAVLVFVGTGAPKGVELVDPKNAEGEVVLGLIAGGVTVAVEDVFDPNNIPVPVPPNIDFWGSALEALNKELLLVVEVPNIVAGCVPKLFPAKIDYFGCDSPGPWAKENWTGAGLVESF